MLDADCRQQHELYTLCIGYHGVSSVDCVGKLILMVSGSDLPEAHWLTCLHVQVQQDEEWDDWVQQAFKLLDSNQDGVICEDDMRMTSVDLDEVCVLLCILDILCRAHSKLVYAAHPSQPSSVPQQLGQLSCFS